MPAAVPLSDNGATSTLSSSAYAMQPGTVAGSTHYVVAGLVAGSLVVLLVLHILGFRFAFDVSVGRR
jgi:hypothetical protein